MKCACEAYGDLRLEDEDICSRVRETPRIKRGLTSVAIDRTRRTELYRCPRCATLWQAGRYRYSPPNGGDTETREYLFKVPSIEPDEWKNQPFVQPANLLSFERELPSYYAISSGAVSERPCRTDACGKKTLGASVYCREHHIQRCEQDGTLPERPWGRAFAFYRIPSEPAIGVGI